MRSIVWVAIKPGEERRFASAREWPEEFVATLKRDGYSILAISYGLPPSFDAADFNVQGRVSRKGNDE